MPSSSPCRAFLLVVGFAAAAARGAVDLPSAIPDGPFDIRAARMEYTNDTFVASGGVTGRFDNVFLRADKVTGNPDTGDLHAEGNIRFERGTALWEGTKLDYNFLRQQGDFGPSHMQFDPAYVSADHVERVSTNEYLLTGANFTTCPLDPPHIHAHAKEARLIDGRYVEAKGVTFYAGKVPIMYLPYWRHYLNQKVFSFRMGYGSRLGAFVETTTTLPVTKNIDSLTDLNLYGARGVGLGQGFKWETPSATGQFASFYLRDQDPYRRHDSTLISDDRYRLKLEHVQRFTDLDYLAAKGSYLSDPYVNEEFFRREYRNEVQPESYAAWVHGSDNFGTEAFASKALNDFFDNTDRYEYSLDLYRGRIGDSPFYFQSENSVAALDRTYSSTNTVDTGYDAARLDTANAIYMPYRLGYLNLVPRATYRATYYSETREPGGSDDVRLVPGAGIEASVEATKVLSEQERWYGKGLRHKIEPYIGYDYADSSLSTNQLYQFDDIDRIDDLNQVRFGVRNVLQTKRNDRTSRFIDLDLYTAYLVSQNPAGDNFDLLHIDARMPLTERLMANVEGGYDWYRGTVPFFDTRLAYTADESRVSLEHLYEEGRQSLWTPRIDLFPKGNVSLEGYVRYDDRSNDLQETAVIAYMNRCCMRYGLGYHYYDTDEQQIIFSIGLSAFPEAKISSGF